MIIKSQRVAAKGSIKRLCDHVFRGDGNDRIVVLQGGERDVRDFFRDAREHGSRFALRHWQLCPAEVTSREQAFEALRELATEYAFPPETATLVEHGKDRIVPEAFDGHWHVLVGEVDPVSGRVLSSAHDFARHEYLARVMEFRWGHEFVIGAHTRSVLARMRREGLAREVEALSAAFEASPAARERPVEAFTSAEHQTAKRRGVALPEVREVVQAAWRSCTSLSGLNAALADAGLDLFPGKVAGEWIVPCGGVEKSLRRLTKTPKADFTKRMKEIIDADEYGKRKGEDVRRKDLDRDGRDQGGTRYAAPVCESSGPSTGGAGGELHAGDNATARLADGGNGGNPQAARSLDCDGRRSAHDGGSPLGGSGALIATTTTCVGAVFALVQRASVSARPAPKRLEIILARQENLATATRSSPLKGTSNAEVKAFQAAERSAREDAAAVSTEIAEINERISALFIQQRERRGSPWLRLMPDRHAAPVIAELKERRERLRSRADTLAQIRLRADIDAGKARIDHAKVVAQSEREREAAIASAENKLAILALARRLLARVPALAYVGARTLLAYATRVKHAREQGYDPGPSRWQRRASDSNP